MSRISTHGSSWLAILVSLVVYSMKPWQGSPGLRNYPLSSIIYDTLYCLGDCISIHKQFCTFCWKWPVAHSVLYHIIQYSTKKLYIMNNFNHRLRTSDSHGHQFIPNMLRKSSCCPWCREEIHNNTGRPHFHAEHPSCGEILKENSI